MKKFIAILIFFVFPCTITQAQTTVVFITRHADRVPNVDMLSPEGVVRAEALKRVLIPANINAIYSTDFTRTRETASPTATQLTLPINLYSSTRQVINRVLTTNIGKRVLIVGHSDTVDSLVRNCGCTSNIGVLPSNAFDNLYVVVVHKYKYKAGWWWSPVWEKECTLIKMKYGAVIN